MKSRKYLQDFFSVGVFVAGATLALAGPAAASTITFPLEDLTGQIQYDFDNDGVSVDGTSRDVYAQDLQFTVPDIDSSRFNNTINGPYPLVFDVSLTGAFSGEQETLNLSHTFEDATSFVNFFLGLTGYIGFDNGNLNGSLLSRPVSDLIGSFDPGEFTCGGGSQLCGGTFNLAFNISDIASGSGNVSFEDGGGSVTLTDVPAPGAIGLFALSLLGIGFLLRRRSHKQ